MRLGSRWAFVLAAGAIVMTGGLLPSSAGASQRGGLGAELSPLVRQVMHDDAVPGAVVLVRTPGGTFLRAFGSRVAGRDVPMTVNDHFRIGSNTKTMTGTAILQLVQNGRLRLSDPVSKYLANVPNGRNITIAQLLNMRSGLDTYSNLRWFNHQLDVNPTRVWDPAHLVRVGLALPPVAQPGHKFFYSNTNTLMLGLIVEKLTHHSLAWVFEHRIFQPLGLHDTLLPALASNAIPSPHPQGYLFGTNVSTLDDLALPPHQQQLAIQGKLLPNDVTNENPSWGWAAGAGISDARDLATYVQKLVGGGLLDPALQERRLESVRSTDPGNPNAALYGLGIAKFGPLYGHDGSLPGFQSFMGYDPDRRITMIVLCNLQNAPDGTQPANNIAIALLSRLYS